MCTNKNSYLIQLTCKLLILVHNDKPTNATLWYTSHELYANLDHVCLSNQFGAVKHNDSIICSKPNCRNTRYDNTLRYESILEGSSKSRSIQHYDIDQETKL